MKCTCSDHVSERCKVHTFGYPSSEECEVCGKYKNNQMEPRFLYVVCEDHQNVAPINIKREKEKTCGE